MTIGREPRPPSTRVNAIIPGSIIDRVVRMAQKYRPILAKVSDAELLGVAAAVSEELAIRGLSR